MSARDTTGGLHKLSTLVMSNACIEPNYRYLLRC
jgi:hypothetical protein